MLCGKFIIYLEDNFINLYNIYFILNEIYQNIDDKNAINSEITINKLITYTNFRNLYELKDRYDSNPNKMVKLEIAYDINRCITLIITDKGNGIENVEKAMEPLFTTRPEADRSGMGFSFMEAFMDELRVESEPGKGTVVKMQKIIGKGRELWTEQSL